MKRRIEHGLIMAAGRGARMMPLTQSIPKALAPYQNSTLILSGINKIRSYLQNVHVTVGYKGAMVAQHLIENGVSSVFNTDGQTNSWWIFNTLMKHVDGPVFVLTCDNVTDIDFAELEADYFDAGAPACLLVPVRPVPGLAGDYIFRESRRVTALSRERASDIYCSGIQVLNPAFVNRTCSGSGDFGQLWSELIVREQLMVSAVVPKKWFTVDTLSDLQRVNEIESR